MDISDDAGAVYLKFVKRAEINNSYFEKNFARNGGAFTLHNSSYLIVLNCTFS